MWNAKSFNLYFLGHPEIEWCLSPRATRDTSRSRQPLPSRQLSEKYWMDHGNCRVYRPWHESDDELSEIDSKVLKNWNNHIAIYSWEYSHSSFSLPNFWNSYFGLEHFKHRWWKKLWLNCRLSRYLFFLYWWSQNMGWNERIYSDTMFYKRRSRESTRFLLPWPRKDKYIQWQWGQQFIQSLHLTCTFANIGSIFHVVSVDDEFCEYLFACLLGARQVLLRNVHATRLDDVRPWKGLAIQGTVQQPQRRTRYGQLHILWQNWHSHIKHYGFQNVFSRLHFLW